MRRVLLPNIRSQQRRTENNEETWFVISNTWQILGPNLLMTGNYAPAGLNSSLGPVVDFSFRTYTRPLDPQSDLDSDGVGDACDLCPNIIPDASVDSDVCPPLTPADFDRDGDVDTDDVNAFIVCGALRCPALAALRGQGSR